MKTIIAPSLLSADFADLKSEFAMLNISAAQWIHIDVMDGHFVPNITFGPMIVKTVRTLTSKTLDVHLMIEKPERYLDAFKDAGSDIITVHYEACTHLHRTVQHIHDIGAKAGVSVNPHLNVELLRDILPFIDLVLIMSVNPGFGGQKFIETTYSRIKTLKTLKDEINPDLIIEVDGGVNIENGRKLIDCGANALVAGNSIFKSYNQINYIEQMSRL